MLAAFLFLVMLNVMNTMFTIELVVEVVEALNPMICFYLEQGEVPPFLMEYLLPIPVMVLTMAHKNACVGTALRVKAFWYFHLSCMPW